MQMDVSAGIEDEYHHKNNRVILVSLNFISSLFGVLFSLQDPSDDFVGEKLAVLDAGILLERSSLFSSAGFGRVFSSTMT